MKLFELKNVTDIGSKNKLLIQQIVSRCSFFLKQIDYNIVRYPLFRGAQRPNPRKIHTNDVKLTNRPPTGTSQDIHDCVNQYFIEITGEPFLDSLFCSGNEIMSSGYGSTLYLVFPEGHFTFLWSTDTVDLYEITYRTKTCEKIIQKMKEKTYSQTNLKDAILSHNEIMVRSKRFIGYPIGTTRGLDLGLYGIGGARSIIQPQLENLQQQITKFIS